MTKRGTPFNPSRIADMLGNGVYATGLKHDELKSEREDRINWFRKKGKNSRPCLDLADELERCRPKHRCKSPACAECADAGQRLVAKVVRKFLKLQAGDDTKIVCVTIIPADGLIKAEKLNQAVPELGIRRWKARLGKAGVTWFLGATDYSFNEHKQGRYQPRWSVHIFGVTMTNNPKKLKRALKEQFPKTKVILRPVKVEEWDGNKKALRYILKPNFWRRIANDDGQRHNKKTGTERACRDTDMQPLQSKRKRELLLYLHNSGLQARLVSCGALSC